jgi:uncharacterized protein YwgA
MSASDGMEPYARLMAIFQRCGKIRSRIKIQKIVYVLRSLGYPLTERYEYRHYGPYSEDLASELLSCVNARYLEEEKVEGEGEEDQGYTRYDLSIAPRGVQFLETRLRADATETAALQRMSEMAGRLNAHGSAKLELLATLMYLEDNGARPDLMVTMLNDLKPQFHAREIAEAQELALSLRGTAQPS